jgi:RNA polymerase sigma factor for flagellar operon FliA
MNRRSKTDWSSPEAIHALWHRYKRTGDPATREQLVLALVPLVRHIVFKATREMPAQCEVQDLISCGVEAVIRSIDRYDPEKGATLVQFIWTRIHGAILDELRRNDWAPRRLRRVQREVNRARDRFIGANGRSPTLAELSEEIEISHSELLELLDDLDRAEVASLNTVVGGDDEWAIEQIDILPSADETTDPEYAALRSASIERFRAAFGQLSARERAVAVLLHAQDLTLREAGTVLGISESRVCQINGRLKSSLRIHLDSEDRLAGQVA